MLIAEGLLGAAWAAWLVLQLVWVADGVASLLEVPSPRWAAFTGAQIAATAVVPSLAITWVGSRWWHAPAQFGLSRRIGLYVMFGAHVIAGALAVLSTSWTLAGVSAVAAAAALAAVAAGARLRDAEPESPADPLRWGHAGLVAAATILLV
jgi:hypothetical protein